jgi:hypothetical protein
VNLWNQLSLYEANTMAILTKCFPEMDQTCQSQPSKGLGRGWVLSFLANSSPEFKTDAWSWIENVKPNTGLTFLCNNRLLFFRNNLVPGLYFSVITFNPAFNRREIKYHRLFWGYLFTEPRIRARNRARIRARNSSSGFELGF